MAFDLRAQIAGQSALSAAGAPAAVLAAWGGRTDEAQSALGARLTSWFTDAAKDWGAVGDGSTDNSAALIAMRDWMLTQPDRHHVIYFPPGEYRYLNNRWLLGVLSFEVIAHGCTFRCTVASGSGLHVNNSQPLLSMDPWVDTGDATYSAVTAVHNGYLIDTVASGSLTVTCSTVAEAGNFSAGDRALLQGFAQQLDAYPPNPRYFEWLTVTDANATTGVVTFAEPLSFAYDERWYDTTVEGNAIWGAPRLMKLNRTNNMYPRLSIFRGGHWAGSPNDSRDGYNAFSFCSEVQILEDCEFDIFWPRGTRLMIVDRAKVNVLCEPDKVIGTLHFGPGSTFYAAGYNDSFLEASGVQELIIDGCTFYDVVRLRPRRGIMRNCVVHGRSDQQFTVLDCSIFATQRLEITNTHFINHHSALLGFVTINDAESITVLGQSGAAITVTNNPTNLATLQQRVEIGTMLLSRDGTIGGRVTSIYVSTNIVIEGDWFIQPNTGNVLYWMALGELALNGNTFSGGNNAPRIYDRYRAWPGKTTRHEYTGQEVKWTGEDVLHHFVRGRVMRIAVSIDKVYTGASGTATLAFYDDDSGTGGNELLTVDLKTAGFREVNAIGKRLLGADTGDETDIGKWCHWLSTRIVGTSTATVAELPRLRIVVDVLG